MAIFRNLLVLVRIQLSMRLRHRRETAHADSMSSTSRNCRIKSKLRSSRTAKGSSRLIATDAFAESKFGLASIDASFVAFLTGLRLGLITRPLALGMIFVAGGAAFDRVVRCGGILSCGCGRGGPADRKYLRSLSLSRDGRQQLQERV